MNIRKKMVFGAFWLLLEKSSQQISSFIVFAFIVRVIGPEEYGLVATCGIILALFEGIISGLVDAVVSKNVRDNKRLSSIFWFIIFTGVFVSLIFYLLASYLYNKYDKSIFIILQAFSIMPFLYSLASVPNVLIVSKLNFKIFSIRSFFATLGGSVAGISLCYFNYGAFAIVGQQIISQGIMCFVVWSSLEWRPGFILDFKSIINMLSHGFSHVGSFIVGFVDSQMPRIVLGVFLGSTAVGLYSFVLRICGTIQDGIVEPVLNVFYPGIAAMIDDSDKKQQLLNESILLVCVMMVPLTTGIIVTAPLFVPIIFGSEWSLAIIPIQIFVFTTIFFSFNIIFKSYMRAHSRVNLYLKIQIIIIFISMIIYVFVIEKSLINVVITKTATSFVLFILYALIIKKFFLVNFKSIKNMLISSVMSALIMGVVLILFQNFLINKSYGSLTTLIYSVLLGVIIYFGSLISINKDYFSLLKNFYVKNKFQK